MGAWGYGPFENDSGLDWLGYFISNKALAKLVKQRYNNLDPNELRVAAAVVIHLHKIHDLWFDQEIIDMLTEHLEQLVEDKEWFDDWRDARDARDIKKEIRKYIRELKKLEGYYVVRAPRY